MPFPRLNPNTVAISFYAPEDVSNEYPASAVIIPGMLIENHNSSGLKWRPNSSASNMVQNTVALEQDILNRGIDYPYAVNDLVVALNLNAGDKFLGIVPSGQNITAGDLLQSNGDGRLKAASDVTATGNVGLYRALDTTGAVVADTRLRVQVL